MNKMTRVLGTTLAGAALIGGTATAASAHHGGTYGEHSYSLAHHGAFSPQGARHEFAGFSRHHEDGDGSFEVGPHFGHHWFHHFNRGHHHHWTFAEQQAAIVDRLTDADQRLSALIAYLSDKASSDPNSWAAQALPYLQQQQSRLESLIAAVKAATNEDELRAAFANAWKPTPSRTPTPSTTPTPTTAPTPTASPLPTGGVSPTA